MGSYMKMLISQGREHDFLSSFASIRIIILSSHFNIIENLQKKKLPVLSHA